MKKTVIFFLSLCLCIVPCFSSLAAQKETFSEERINGIPEEILTDFEKNIVLAKNSRNSSISEFEIYKKAKYMSTKELVKQGYTSEDANKIQNGELEEVILQAFFERSNLPSDTLSNMGYTMKDIQKMKNLTGNETLSDIEALAVSAKVTCYNTLKSHYYEKSTNKTHFIVSYGWEWNKTPLMQLTDCIGIGWNQDFSIKSDASSSYNKHYKVYINRNNSSDKKSINTTLKEKQLQTIEDKFSVSTEYNLKYYDIKSGSGIMYLIQEGKANNAKFSMKYGHNTIGTSPSIGYPWGVSFSFSNAESIFMPDEIVTSVTATVK